MGSVRVKRGGLTLVLTTEAGRMLIGLSAGRCKTIIESIACSAVGLLNVLNGVDYVAVDAGRQCLARLLDRHVELILRRGKIDAIFRLTVDEYRFLLNSAGRECDSAA